MIALRVARAPKSPEDEALDRRRGEPGIDERDDVERLRTAEVESQSCVVVVVSVRQGRKGAVAAASEEQNVHAWPEPVTDAAAASARFVKDRRKTRPCQAFRATSWTAARRPRDAQPPLKDLDDLIRRLARVHRT